MDWAEMTDFEVLDAWRVGDRAAGSVLIARHFDDLYAFFRSKIEHAAEDLTQQTFLSCIESRDRFRGATSFRVYLFVVARNCLYSHLKRKVNRTKDAEFEVASLADLEPSASAVLVFREDHRLLVHALRRLSVDLQVALELYYVQRLKGAEIAEVLGLPIGTVRSRIRRAIEQLRESALGLASTPLRTTVTDLRRWAELVRARSSSTPAA